MRELHDRVKLDLAYQRTAPKRRIEFPPGSSWIVFSDQVLHSVLSGRMALEQTWMLPVASSYDPDTAPLRVLEGLSGRPLA
jgi:hypothetical protein